MKLWLFITKGYTWRYSPCIWRVIINNFLLLLDFPSCGIVNLLKIKVFFCEANFHERNTTEIKAFWHCVHATEILMWTIPSLWKITILTFLRGEGMYSRRRALNAKELNTWVNDDQGNIDYWRHGKGECLKFHPNTPEFPNAVKQLRCSMVQ